MAYDAATLDNLAGIVWPQLESAYSLPPGILRAIAYWETRGRYDDRTSGAGASGLMQLTPIAIQQVQIDAGFVADPHDPYQSSTAAAVLLHRFLSRFHSLALAVAAYNAGESRIARYLSSVKARGSGVLPVETVQYVQGVTNALASG